jgi:hypothetical protein
MKLNKTLLEDFGSMKGHTVLYMEKSINTPRSQIFIQYTV